MSDDTFARPRLLERRRVRDGAAAIGVLAIIFALTFLSLRAAAGPSALALHAPVGLETSTTVEAGELGSAVAHPAPPPELVVSSPAPPELTTLAASTETPAPPAQASGLTLTPATQGHHGPSLSRDQLYGLALYVSDDTAWADWVVGCWPGESGRGGRFTVGAVGINPDGSTDHGLPQINDIHSRGGVDTERVRRDPVYALTEAYLIYQREGAGAWFGCAS